MAKADVLQRKRKTEKRDGEWEKEKRDGSRGVGVVEVKERGENIDMVICLEGNITYVCIYFNR